MNENQLVYSSFEVLPENTLEEPFDEFKFLDECVNEILQDSNLFSGNTELMKFWINKTNKPDVYEVLITKYTDVIASYHVTNVNGKAGNIQKVFQMV